MSLRTRLARLEQRCPRPGTGCPRCPPIRVVTYRQADIASEPVLEKGQVLPALWAPCGRPVDVEEIVNVVIKSRDDLLRWQRAQSDG